MKMKNWIVRTAMALVACAFISAHGFAQQQGRENLKEPLLRVANLPKDKPHALDPALRWAEQIHRKIQKDVRDYTCTMVKRERVKGELTEYQYIHTKIRNRKTQGNRLLSPMGIYMYFLKPSGLKGQEVLWVEGENNGKLVAKAGGRLGAITPTVRLDPKGALAMKGQRYPIMDAGIENLAFKLIERGLQDRKIVKDCEVKFHRGAKINGRVCTLLMVRHPQKKANLDFHIAQIFVDDELGVPIRYAAYDWPAQAGGKPQLIEEYTYLNLKINPGLAQKDFDPKNPDYNF